MFKSLNSLSQLLVKWYVGAIAVILFILIGFGVNLILGKVVTSNDLKPFNHEVTYIPLLKSPVSTKFNPSRFDISIKFTELTTTKDLLLVFVFIDSIGNSTYWEKTKIELVTNVLESNTLYHRFYSPSDSIWEQSKEYKIYLWNKGKNKGILNQSKIKIR